MPTQLKFAISTLTMFITSFAAAAAAWPTIEPFMYAHRGYVRQYAQFEANRIAKSLEPTRLGLFDIQISIAKSRRAAINDRILSVEIEAAKSVDAEESIKRRAQIERLKEEREEIDAEIKTLILRKEKD